MEVFPIRTLAIVLLTLTSLLRPAAGVTLTIGLDGVRDGNQTFTSNRSLALVVVRSGQGGFDDPVPGASLDAGKYLVGAQGNGTYIAWKGDFHGPTQAPGQDGLFFQTISITIDASNVPANASLAFYWFPTLTSDSTTLSKGDPFGVYTSLNATQFGSNQAWNIGTNNAASYDLNVFAIDNTGLYAPSNPEQDGVDDLLLSATKLAGVPEPSSALLFGTAALIASLNSARRRRPPRRG